MHRSRQDQRADLRAEVSAIVLAKLRRRLGQRNAVVAFATTFGEAALALLMVRGLNRAPAGRMRA